MTEEQKAGSKLLAEFEGWKESPYPNLPNKMYRESKDEIEVGLHIEQLTYHTDYNELIRVAHKFRDLEVEQKESHKYWVHLIYIAVMRHSKEVAFETVAQAVTWYNSLKQKS